MSGDFAASDRLFSFAAVGDGPNAEKLRNVRDKVLTKYKELAIHRLQDCDTQPVDRGCALEMLTLGRCCMLEGNHEEARLWLNRSLAFFEQHSTESAEVLRIRSHLANIGDI